MEEESARESTPSTRKVAVVFSAKDHADLRLYCSLRETTATKVVRTLWRDYKRRYKSMYSWPPQPLDRMDEIGIDKVDRT